MSVAPILSTPSAAPTGAEADSLAPSNLLLLFIVRLLILWAEGLAASLGQRTETTDLTDVTRAFGTTDIALILERITVGLQRLRALEDKILGRDTDPQLEPVGAATSPRIPSAPQSLRLQPQDVHLLMRLAPECMVAPPVRATGPPRTP
jgi:hypothetical protein